MPKVAIVPVFTIKDGHVEAFHARILQQREDARTREPGCLHFDVTINAEKPNEFVLYEIYADEEALATHRTYPHYADFKETTAPMVESFSITRCYVQD